MEEIKYTGTKMRSAFDRLSRLHIAEERISEFEDISTENCKTEKQGGNILKGREQNI